MDIRNVGDLKTCVLGRIKVDVETIQSRVLLCEYTPVKQRECESCSFVKVKVFIPVGKCDRYDVLEMPIVRHGRTKLPPGLEPWSVESLVLNDDERWSLD